MASSSFLLNPLEEDSTSSFRFTGQYLSPLDNGSSSEVSPVINDSLSTAEDQIGWPVASVVITHEVIDEAGRSHAIELASGSFLNGSLDLSGEIEEMASKSGSASKKDRSLTDDITRLLNKVLNIQLQNLKQFASEEEDPINRLLALELARKILPPSTIKCQEIVELYDQFATLLDSDVVARRVTPARNRIAAFLTRTENTTGILLGETYPKTTLNATTGSDSAHERTSENSVESAMGGGLNGHKFTKASLRFLQKFTQTLTED